jgi:hypothetical protein
MPHVSASSPVLERHRSAVVTVIVILSLVITAVGLRAVTSRDDARGGPAVAIEDAPSPAVAGSPQDPQAATADPAAPARTTPEATSAPADGPAPTAATSEAAEGGGGSNASRASADSASPPPATTSGRSRPAGSGTSLPGVTEDEITVVYYWKGDRTRTSPYLAGSGAEANVDEAEAFRKLIDYINANDGTGTLVGHPIDLHGRTLEGVVVEAGSSPEDFAATAQRITEEIRPFAAVAAHGSISAYLCPALADAGIHNIATYDLGGRLADSTDGYCLPAGMSWERQVDVTEGFLRRQQAEEPDRVYGVVYAEYPGLVDSAPRMVQRYRDAGIRIAEVASVSADLTTAQQQAPNVVARMRAAGVNTIVMPDAGAPLNITHAAQAQGYDPDYYVWPCSGQDTMGMVRLFNTTQWAGAEGLTCYDEQFTSDVTINDRMRRTEWYAAYRQMAPDSEPPAPTPFVYAALLPLVAGLHDAGPDLTLESFRAGLDGFDAYRYDAIDGRTDEATSLRLGFGGRDRSFIVDAIRLRYDAARREPGSTAPGWYVFPEPRRYASGSAF